MSLETHHPIGSYHSVSALDNQRISFNPPNLKSYGSARHTYNTTSATEPNIFPSLLVFTPSPFKTLPKRSHCDLNLQDERLISNQVDVFGTEPSPNYERALTSTINRSENLPTIDQEQIPWNLNTTDYRHPNKRVKFYDLAQGSGLSSPSDISQPYSTLYSSPSSTSKHDHQLYFLSPHSNLGTPSSTCNDSFRQEFPYHFESQTSQVFDGTPFGLRRASRPPMLLLHGTQNHDQDGRRDRGEKRRYHDDQVPNFSPLTFQNFDTSEDLSSPSRTPSSSQIRLSPEEGSIRSNHTQPENQLSVDERVSYPPDSNFITPFTVPIVSIFVTENLNESLMIMAYLRRRSLNYERGPKNRNVWSPETLFAFEEAIRTIPRLGRAKLMAATEQGKRPFGRNELIADYIYRRTGINRDRKQVSSHIQVIKNSKKVQPLLAELLSSAPEGESIAFNHCTASWYGACINGDVLTLHACTPEFPFPSQMLIHLPTIRSDEEYRNFLNTTRKIRSSTYNRRSQYDLQTSNIIRNPEIISLVRSSQDELDLRPLICDETFKSVSNLRSSLVKLNPHSPIPYNWSQSTDGDMEDESFKSQKSKFGSINHSDNVRVSFSDLSQDIHHSLPLSDLPSSDLFSTANFDVPVKSSSI